MLELSYLVFIQTRIYYTPQLIMQLKIKPIFYAANVECWLKIFEAGELGVNIQGTADKIFEFKTPRTNCVWHVWWYVKRKYAGNRHTDVKTTAEYLNGQSVVETRLILEEDTIERAGTCHFTRDGDYDVSDIEGTKVATLTVKGCTEESKNLTTTKPIVLGLDWQKKVDAATPKETNITELPFRLFGSFKFPDGVFAPMWGYPMLALNLASPNSDAQTTNSVFELACWLLRVKPSDYDKQPIDTRLEINAEMQSLASRMSCYVKDSSKRTDGDHMIDDWTFFEDWPDPSLLEFDCEDSAVHAMQQSLRLKTCNGLTGSSVASAQALEKLYYTAFAVVTLKLGENAYTYHAVCMKFPRLFIDKKLGFIGAASSDTQCPTILVETTAWTTSNWRYKNERICSYDIYDRVIAQTDSANVKVPAPTDPTKSLYIHGCSLIFPELVISEAIGQIQLSYKGKFGVPMDILMTNSDAYDMTPIRIDSWQQISQITPRSMQMPKSTAFQSTTANKLNWDNRAESPKAEFTVRMSDWKKNQEEITKIAKSMGGTKVEFQPITIYSNIAGVCVSVY